MATGAVIGGTIGVLIHGEKAQLDELRKELDEVMEECADHAEQIVNRRRLPGRSLDARECNEIVENTPAPSMTSACATRDWTCTT